MNEIRSDIQGILHHVIQVTSTRYRINSPVGIRSLQEQVSNGWCGETVFQVSTTQIAAAWCWSVGIGKGWPHRSQQADRVASSGANKESDSIIATFHLDPNPPISEHSIRGSSKHRKRWQTVVGREPWWISLMRIKCKKSGSTHQTSPSAAVHALMTCLCCTSKYSMCVHANLVHSDTTICIHIWPTPQL